MPMEQGRDLVEVERGEEQGVALGLRCGLAGEYVGHRAGETG